MTSRFASGKYGTWSICDTCGQRCRYTRTKTTSYNTRVCPSCYDGGYDILNHPQSQPLQQFFDGPVEWARPDVSFAGGRRPAWTATTRLTLDGYMGRTGGSYTR